MTECLLGFSDAFLYMQQQQHRPHNPVIWLYGTSTKEQQQSHQSEQQESGSQEREKADRKANRKNENTNSKKRLTDPLRPQSASSESLPRSTDTLQDRQRSALSGALETGSRLRAQASSEQLSVAHFFLDILDVNPVLNVSRGRAWQAAYFELDLFLPKKRVFPIINSFPVCLKRDLKTVFKNVPPHKRTSFWGRAERRGSSLSLSPFLLLKHTRRR